jgi:hypothetical protein
MSKEAMKLALEALEVATTPLARDRQQVLRAQAALREALAEQPAQQEPVAAECNFVGTKEWGRCSIEHHNLVQSEPHKWPGYQTRLLYTSHQPEQQEPTVPATAYNRLFALNEANAARIIELEAAQPQQEPVAWATQIGEYAHIKWGAKRPDYPIRYEVPLYTTPQPCQTCEALARTVMLDQTSHDAHRKPTDEMVVAAARVLSDRQAAACNVDFGDMWKLHGNDFIEDARAALEAANSIREKNT